MSTFVDRVEIEARAGDGGNGCLSFRREKYVPRGGPNGGNGGRGGNVVLIGDAHVRTLLDFTYKRIFKAGRGGHGQGSNKTGRDGVTLQLRIPVGTVILEVGGEQLGEVLVDGEELVVAQGGRGGRGNAVFKSATDRAPRRTEPGAPGETRRLLLELKLLADAGLVGLPNAGKSTILSVISAALPKIAAYPFTTLAPVLGVVAVTEDRSFVLADIPGLVEGAHLGRGLGLRFLRHVERTRLLVLVLDASAEDVRGDYEALLSELGAYAPGLETRRRLVVLNKIDLVTPNDLDQLRTRLDVPETVLEISALHRTGLEAFVRAVAGELETA